MPARPIRRCKPCKFPARAEDFLALLATHPPIEDRIARLERPVIG